MENILIRRGTIEDIPNIRELLFELKAYNNIPYSSSLSIKDLEVDTEKKFFQTLVAERNTSEGKRIIGYALYYFMYSSFLGRSSYLEDLYVTKEFRHCGVGGDLLKALVKDVLEVGCVRVDFAVANWNDPSIKFYKKYGAVNLTKEDGWNMFRLEKENMIQLAENSNIKTMLSVTTNDNCMANVVIRKGEKKDCPELLRNIYGIHDYASCPFQITINVEDLEEDGFGDREFYRSFVAEADTAEGKKIVGYALYFLGYSSDVGRSSYMEDIFVSESYRHLGLGSSLWKAVIQDVLESGCVESVFSVLSWNTSSIEFYNKYGAYNYTERNGWEFYRIAEDDMKKLIE